MKFALVVLVALPLAGCQTGTPITTPSRQPEITISNVRLDCVRGVFANALIDNGFHIQTSNDSQIVAARQTTNTAAQMLLSSQYGGYPDERVVVNFIPGLEENNFRIVVTGAYVTNPGSAFEKSTPVTATNEDEQMLLSKKSQFEDKCKA